MTSNTDAPERIWATASPMLQWKAGDWSIEKDDLMPEMGPRMEYVRADLATRQQAEAVGAVAERLPRPKDVSTWTLDPDFVMKVTHDIDREGWEATMEVVELAMLAAERALSAKLQEPLEVKPLEWADEKEARIRHQKDGQIEFYDLSGMYCIRERGTRYTVRFLSAPVIVRNNVSLAKAAAQAHHEARVRAMLIDRGG